MKATILQIVGLSSISLGFGLIWLPLGVISAGICVLLVGLAWERVEDAQSPTE